MAEIHRFHKCTYVIASRNKSSDVPQSFTDGFQWSYDYFIGHWMQITMVFLLLCLSVLVSWLYFAYEKKQTAIKADFAKQLSAYKLIALKAQVNPHFMSNCLTSIQNLIMKNENDKAFYYISQFGILVRKVLAYSDQLFITLDEEMEITRLYIEMEQLRFDQKFVYRPIRDANINVHALYVPPMILNPIVENAIWHGLLPRPQKQDGLLVVELRVRQHQLVIRIRDNGVGRGKQPENKQAFGTNLTKQRLHNVDFLMRQQGSTLKYTDLKDPGGNALGTEVEIQLPILLTPINYEKNQNPGSG